MQSLASFLLYHILMQVYRIFYCFCHNILASFCRLNSDIAKDSVEIWSGTNYDWATTKYISINLNDIIFDRIYNGGYYTHILLILGGGNNAVGATNGNINCLLPITYIQEWNVGWDMIQSKFAFANVISSTKTLRIWCDSNPTVPLRSIYLVKR